MELVVLFIVLALLMLAVSLIIIFRNRKGGDLSPLLQSLGELQTALMRTEAGVKDEFRVNRAEAAAGAQAGRVELQKAIAEFRTELMLSVKNMMEQNNAALEKIERKMEQQLAMLNEQARADANQMRVALAEAFKGFGETFDKNVRAFNELQREKFALMEGRQQELVKGTETKLDIIRATVEEKLEKTLSERLGQSFETVGKQLIEVQKGLGEMQTLAQDVGGLKRVLSNVKMRGGIGEVQLAMLLEQILAPEQYAANVKTKAGSSEAVEFAIRLPGRDNSGAQVWLPVDAKFPKDVYEQLQDAYDGTVGPDSA